MTRSDTIAVIDIRELTAIHRYCCQLVGRHAVAVNPVVGGQKKCFDPERLQEMKVEIKAMVDLLPDVFRSKAGALFQSAFQTNEGHQWTEDTEAVQWLLQLGIGAGLIIVEDVYYKILE